MTTLRSSNSLPIFDGENYEHYRSLLHQRLKTKGHATIMTLETGGSGIVAAPADASVDATAYNKQQQDIGKCCEIITLSLSPRIHNFVRDLPYPGDMLNKLDSLFRRVDQIEAVGLLKQLMSHKVNEASFTTDISTLKDLLNKLTLYANKPENPILSVGSSTQATIAVFCLPDEYHDLFRGANAAKTVDEALNTAMVEHSRRSKKGVIPEEQALFTKTGSKHSEYCAFKHSSVPDRKR